MRDNRRAVSQTPSEYDEKVIQIKRISKKSKGGSQMSFAALVAVGDRKGRVGTGYAKALDVAGAVNKAMGNAKKNLFLVKLKGQTIAHEVVAKYGAAKVMLKPAPKGSGVIAGGPIRTVVELAGIKDLSAKMIGTNNKITNTRCTLKALGMLKG